MASHLTITQQSGNWEAALEIASSKDRINLKGSFYRFGRHLDEMGDTSGAVAAYEQSSALALEILRLLLLRNGEMESYVATSKDAGIKKWWAQYLESKGDFEGAIGFYKEAKDQLNQVRLMCLSNDLTRVRTSLNLLINHLTVRSGY